ncbi:sucrose nonfermenting 4-like protein isoform X1 [Populus alba x Populus x berolinensis]|uniref:Sucrose nonfermenting 4-like protein isoform X1 n=1 Tax=Populus alba x Populus x berolinensis TaxID=444605 RepID=A0AAD6LW10_9ROSI|nr:sucrose nonfermenting 4-like protein isoform X1 [Populus alba x Populus x berolinensis]
MFGSGSSTGHDNSGVSPVRFVWPYGGGEVSIFGTFTRWTDLIPMSPMEGCPNVYQVVVSLVPGLHQFKFYVDGQWRVDEQLSFVSGPYGLVNTVVLTKDPPQIIDSETPGRSNMELDDVSVCPEVIQGMSAADVEVSRHRISAFLSSHTAYELLPESGKVIALDVTLPVKRAFHILYEQGIPTAPLWDFCKGQFVGVLAALDFILILRELGTHGSNLTEEELETHTISAWKEGKMHLSRQIDGSGRAYSKHLIHAGPYDSLKDVASKFLQNSISTVPILHSSAQDGSFPQLLHLASLSGILKCICRYFRHSAGSLPILQQPICSIPLGTWVPKIGEPNRRPFAMLKPNASLGAALSLLVQANVSSIPIVNDNDSLLDVYSRSDITALAKDKAYAQIHLDEISIHQALQLGQDTNSSYGFFNGQRCQMCLRTDSLHKVMERLANPGVRRLLIVEAGSKRVEGVISLSDVFKFLLGVA